MTEYEFNEILKEVIASFYMEGIIIPNEVIEKIKQKYITIDSKVLVKGGLYDNKRAK